MFYYEHVFPVKQRYFLVTVKDAEALRTEDPLAGVTVSAYVPRRVAVVVVIASVELPGATSDAGVNVAVAPAGSP